jgi:hypothetical protein
MLSNYVPFIRDIPVGNNLKFKNACAVISRISKKLVEEKYKEAENGELKNKDLLSLLINTNKSLPDEEKMTFEELKYQVIKKNFYLFICLFIYFYLFYLFIFFLANISDYDIFNGWA